MIKFEKAKIEDAKELMEIQIRAFNEDVIKYGSGPSGYDSLEWQMKMIMGGNYYKVIYNNGTVGGIAVKPQEDGRYHLYRIFIDPALQNKGIGQKTIEYLESQYDDARKWTLDTPYSSFRNHHFYEKMGYKKVGETQPDENGFYLFLYEKTF